jgi:peptide/nickel transport system permease protein
MLRFFLRRLSHAVIVVCGVAVLVFSLIHLIPGDPVEVMLGEAAQPADLQALRHALGLDQALHIQFWRYLQGLAHLDFGNSLHSRRPVLDLLLERLPATLELTAAALLLAISVALPLGVIAALRKDSGWDRSAMAFAMLGVSVPSFWMGPVLILVFAVWLGWLPVSGRDGFSSLLLPALTLGLGMAAILARMVRSALLDTLNEDYIRTARAKGLPMRTVVWRHALRNALLPVITLLGLQLGALLGGTVITETVFAWPGIGLLVVESIQRRDYPVVQACVLFISIAYVLVNTLTDLVYAQVDPRVRLGDSS